MQTETSRGPLTGPEGDGPVPTGGPWWRALLEMRWRARLQEVTELALAYHEAAAAAGPRTGGGGGGGAPGTRARRGAAGAGWCPPAGPARTQTGRVPACRRDATAGAKAARAPSRRCGWPPCPRPATAPGAPGGGADDRAALGLGRLCRLRGNDAGPRPVRAASPGPPGLPHRGRRLERGLDRPRRRLRRPAVDLARRRHRAGLPRRLP